MKLSWVLALALAAAPALAEPVYGIRPARRAPPWLEDCASQLLVRAMMDEARARLIKSGLRVTDQTKIEPTKADLEVATRKLQETLDNLMTLSGLTPIARADGF